MWDVEKMVQTREAEKFSDKDSLMTYWVEGKEGKLNLSVSSNLLNNYRDGDFVIYDKLKRENGDDLDYVIIMTEEEAKEFEKNHPTLKKYRNHDLGRSSKDNVPLEIGEIFG